jgi:hypothetical protein
MDKSNGIYFCKGIDASNTESGANADKKEENSVVVIC